MSTRILTTRLKEFRLKKAVNRAVVLCLALQCTGSAQERGDLDLQYVRDAVLAHQSLRTDISFVERQFSDVPPFQADPFDLEQYGFPTHHEYKDGMMSFRSETERAVFSTKFDGDVTKQLVSEKNKEYRTHVHSGAIEAGIGLPAQRYCVRNYLGDLNYMLSMKSGWISLDEALTFPSARIATDRHLVNGVNCVQIEVQYAHDKYNDTEITATIDLAPEYDWLPIRVSQRASGARTGPVETYSVNEFVKTGEFGEFWFPKKITRSFFHELPDGTLEEFDRQHAYIEEVQFNQGLVTADFVLTFPSNTHVTNTICAEYYTNK